MSLDPEVTDAVNRHFNAFPGPAFDRNTGALQPGGLTMDHRWHQPQQHGGSGSPTQSYPMSILGAENYLDGNTLFVAQSLAEMAQQQPGTRQVSQVAGMGYTFEMTRERAVTPEALNARMAGGVRRRLSASMDRRSNNDVEMANSPPPDNQAGKRKRKRKTSPEGEDGEEDGEKKSRGRPRLETKDETAADRRRTQIRLAQRAYRNRKETTITSLEQQVEKLQSTQEQMNKAFLELYELAMNKGLIQKEPEFGQRLQSATKHFVSLAKGDNSGTRGQMAGQDASNGPAGSESSEKSRGVQDVNRPAPDDEASSQLTTQTLWGYTFNNGAADEIDYSHQKRWLEQSHMPPPPRPRQHQIIATASEQNASFPFDMYHYNTNIPNNVGTTATASLNMAPNLPLQIDLSPFNSLPPVNSYAHTETTFARRLHRSIIERGLHLITSSNPDPRVWERVFGLSLRLYSREMMTQVFRDVLAQNKHQTLNAWNLPFIHLGGGGTHFPSPDGTMPHFGTGMSMGPLIQSVAETREKFLVDEFRANIPGYEGEWFDSNDVEVYLRGRGVTIPGDAEWVTIDLDKVTLVDDDGTPTTKSPGTGTVSSTDRSVCTGPDPPSPQTPRSTVARMSNAGSVQQGNDTSFDFFSAGANSGTQGNFAMPHVAGFTDWIGQGLGMGQSQKKSNTAAFGNPPFFSHPVTGPTAVSRFPESGIEMPPAEIFNPRLLTLSVSTLVDFIGQRGVCLGRAPGFRPYDIDSALRRTIQEADIGDMFS